MQKQVQALFDKQMSRKEFIATLGFGAVSLMGFGSVLSFLRGQSHGQNASSQASHGYGSSPYGK